MGICRGEASRYDLRFLGILPVVVVSNDSAAGVVQFERRILQWIGDAKIGKRRSNSSHHHDVVN